MNLHRWYLPFVIKMTKKTRLLNFGIIIFVKTKHFHTFRKLLRTFHFLKLQKWKKYVYFFFTFLLEYFETSPHKYVQYRQNVRR